MIRARRADLLGRGPRAVHLDAGAAALALGLVGIEQLDLLEFALEHQGGEARRQRGGIDAALGRAERTGKAELDGRRRTGPALRRRQAGENSLGVEASAAQIDPEGAVPAGGSEIEPERGGAQHAADQSDGGGRRSLGDERCGGELFRDERLGAAVAEGIVLGQRPDERPVEGGRIGLGQADL